MRERNMLDSLVGRTMDSAHPTEPQLKVYISARLILQCYDCTVIFYYCFHIRVHLPFIYAILTLWLNIVCTYYSNAFPKPVLSL